jgi:hypothetical protein
MLYSFWLCWGSSSNVIKSSFAIRVEAFRFDAASEDYKEPLHHQLVHAQNRTSSVQPALSIILLLLLLLFLQQRGYSINDHPEIYYFFSSWPVTFFLVKLSGGIRTCPKAPFRDRLLTCSLMKG